MKIVPIQIPKQNEYKMEDTKTVIVDHCAIVGIQYHESKTHKGEITLLFAFSDKLDDSEAIYAQVMFLLDREFEEKVYKAHPLNINNWGEDIKEKVYKPIISNMKYGENTYLTDFSFSIPSLTGKTSKYYNFEGYYFDKDTKIGHHTKVCFNQGLWLQLSQFLYWIMTCSPLAPDVFEVPAYDKARLIPVTGMTYDGCTITTFYQQQIVMAHFVLYAGSILESIKKPINIPVSIRDGKLFNKAIQESKYITLYSKDDTILPDRSFKIFSPEPMSVILSNDAMNQMTMYTIAKDVEERIHWGDWYKYIYINKKEEIKL